MKATLPNIKTFINRTPREEAAESVPEPPKPPPDLNLFFMLSHLEEDGPVRLDGVKLAVSEVMGLELDEPKLGPLPVPSTPWTSRCNCWCASTRRCCKGCGNACTRPSRRTCRIRPGTPPTPWGGC